MAHVWVLYVGGVLPVGRWCAIYPKSGGVVNGLPGMFIDVFRIRDLVILQCAGVVSSPTSFKSDAGFACGSPFGRDKDNTVGTPRTVYRRRSSIFQDTDAFDVFGVDGG